MALGPAEVAHGPMFIGVIFNVVLYGIMITQCFLYYTNFKKDRLWIKLFVAFLFIADTINAVFDIVYLYDSLIIHFADVQFLTTANWVFATDPAMTGIIGSIVQCFFAWRVFILTKRKLLLIPIVLCAAAGFFCSIATSIAIGIVPHFVDFQRFKVVVIIWLVSAAVGDVIITVALVTHLRHHRTGFSKTDDVLNRVIRLTLQTGAVTSLWAVVDLIVFLTNPTGLHLVFNVPLSKLYTNSLMSSLNARGGWGRVGGSNGHPSTNAMSTPAELQQTKSLPIGRKPDVIQFNVGGRPQVFVHVESHEMVDVADSEVDGKSAAACSETMGPLGTAQVAGLGYSSKNGSVWDPEKVTDKDVV